ncbi:hypothetical protein UC317_0477 [Lactococcus lactis subsp. lactis]|uniref:hypothetical protein n=1 Tax=Lactococcus TaxID=1357 RepID=UPI00072B192F|nr:MULTISPECIES: hypothetical protein [Lactococcus]ARE12098.1 hypothetical protein LLUC063_2293 [Lactococcus lactis subsp. lactis]KSU33557.1 hypothetical protein UC317_0477 [Lactococcus lactis subsp. lactis]MDM7652769.1 hypothetical protein [Lactococcus cremoris]UPG97796.1 hypothetical protein MXM90_11580 [Lactococcus lactis]URL08797.1 hypothetical protein L1704_12030 [Lactococcus lactis subsp. lactis]
MYNNFNLDNIGKIGKILLVCMFVLIGICIAPLFHALTPTDWISILAILVPTIFSVIAINQTKQSTLNSEKIIEEANRPYIVPHVEISTSGRFIKYLSIRNYGKTAGKILTITFYGELDKYHNNNQLKSLNQRTFAPQQNITSEFETDFSNIISGEIKYVSLITNKIYTEKFELNFDTVNFLWSKEQEISENPADSVPQAIYETTTQLIKTLK